jgi:hypothetical protein
MALVDEGSIFRHEPGSPAARAAATAPIPVVAIEESGSRAIALAAGAAVAVLGGLLWAGSVIETRYDVGILAWVVGAATGFTVHRLGGTTVTKADRVAAGVLAAAGILLGKYVIFVHDLKVDVREVLHTSPTFVGYFNTREMHLFVHHFGEIVRPIYALWIGLALLAGFRVSGGQNVFGRRRS